MMTEEQLKAKIKEHQEMVDYADVFINKRRKENKHSSVKYWENIREFYQNRVEAFKLVLNHE